MPSCASSFLHLIGGGFLTWFKKKQKQKVPISSVIPARMFEWEESPDGLVHILVPRFEHPIFTALFRRRNTHSPLARIKLDKIGSYIWLQVNGVLTLEEITEVSRAHFGSEIEPAADRVSLFLNTMAANKLITFERV
jgi:Coenzyme PQQ synthesis protein D (PqqD)